jgi:hypothetical protein
MLSYPKFTLYSQNFLRSIPLTPGPDQGIFGSPI